MYIRGGMTCTPNSILNFSSYICGMHLYLLVDIYIQDKTLIINHKLGVDIQEILLFGYFYKEKNMISLLPGNLLVSND